MLVITEVSLSDRGFYRCSVTNSEGTVTSSPAVLNVQGIYQYLIPVTLPVTASGPFVVGETPSDEVIASISSLVDRLNAEVAGSSVGIDPVFILFNVDTSGNITTVSSTE